jgi:hypothetical protein
MVILYKSCRVLHQKSNKIGFAFFWFLYNFLGILEDPANSSTLFKKQVTRRSRETLISLQISPCFALRPLERKVSSQLGPSAGWRRGWPESGELAAAHGRGKVGSGVPDRWGSIPQLAWGKGAAGEEARRCSRAAAAWSSAPAKSQRRQGKKCWRRLH